MQADQGDQDAPSGSLPGCPLGIASLRPRPPYPCSAKISSAVRLLTFFRSAADRVLWIWLCRHWDRNPGPRACAPLPEHQDPAVLGGGRKRMGHTLQRDS